MSDSAELMKKATAILYKRNMNAADVEEYKRLMKLAVEGK